MRRIRGRFSLTLAAGLAVLWLVLNQTLAPGHIALGAALGCAFSWAVGALRPLRARVRRAGTAVQLALVVFGDIVRSNVAVARIVLWGGGRKVRSGFLDIPLELRDPHGLAALAAIVTSTPGTVWVNLSPDGATLTLHVLDLKDEAEWIDLIKRRYERPLMRIFE